MKKHIVFFHDEFSVGIDVRFDGVCPKVLMYHSSKVPPCNYDVVQKAGRGQRDIYRSEACLFMVGDPREAATLAIQVNTVDHFPSLDAEKVLKKLIKDCEVHQKAKGKRKAKETGLLVSEFEMKKDSEAYVSPFDQKLK